MTLPRMGVIIVDHGSRRQESNDKLLELVEQFRAAKEYSIVEPAHMELAEPSIGDAYDRCVQRGAERVVVAPFFLLPGRHWIGDIPRLTAEAAARHPSVTYLVASPLGLHPLLSQVIDDRIRQCLSHAAGDAPACSLCEGTDACQFHNG